MAEERTIHKFRKGDVFHGRYRLERIVGTGGFADVWKAEDTYTQSIVALKIYTMLAEEDIKALAMEYVRMKDLSHTNLLRAEHFDSYESIPYQVMHYCEGGSLAKKAGKMEDEELLRVTKDMLKGLAYLHENHIIHQDIKPANVLVDNCEGKARYMLSDFGISTKSKTKLTHSADSGEAMTEAYAAPERFSSKKADREADGRSDIFSLGVSLYELATGEMPFDDLSTGRELWYGEDGMIEFNDIKNPVLRQAIALCMKRNKADRPSANELLYKLEHGFGQGKSATEPPTDRSVEGSKPQRKVSPWLFGSLGAVVVLCLAIVLGTDLLKGKEEVSANSPEIISQVKERFNDSTLSTALEKDELYQSLAKNYPAVRKAYQHMNYDGKRYYYSAANYKLLAGFRDDMKQLKSKYNPTKNMVKFSQQQITNLSKWTAFDNTLDKKWEKITSL